MFSNDLTDKKLASVVTGAVRFRSCKRLTPCIQKQLGINKTDIAHTLYLPISTLIIAVSKRKWIDKTSPPCYIVWVSHKNKKTYNLASLTGHSTMSTTGIPFIALFASRLVERSVTLRATSATIVYIFYGGFVALAPCISTN